MPLKRQLHDQALAEHVQQANATPFAVDPETGEIIPSADLLTDPPTTQVVNVDEDAAIARLLDAFPGSEIVTIYEELAA